MYQPQSNLPGRAWAGGACTAGRVFRWAAAVELAGRSPGDLQAREKSATTTVCARGLHGSRLKTDHLLAPAECSAQLEPFEPMNWFTDGPASFASGAWVLSLAFNSFGVPHVGYGGSGSKAAVVKLVGGEWVFVGARFGGTPPSTASKVALAFTAADLLHASFASDLKNPFATYTVHVSVHVPDPAFTDGNWECVGSSVGLTEAPDTISLAVAPRSGQLYVAYYDADHGGRLTVRRLDSGDNRGVNASWENVGNVGFGFGPQNVIDSAHLAFPFGLDTPHLTYPDQHFGFPVRATVMRLAPNTSTWTALGRAGFTPYGGDATRVTLAFSPSTNGGSEPRGS